MLAFGNVGVSYRCKVLPWRSQKWAAGSGRWLKRPWPTAVNLGASATAQFSVRFDSGPPIGFSCPRLSWPRLPLSATMTPGRFPAPWSAEKIAGGYVVREAMGQALADIYIRATESDAMQAMVLTDDEARRVAVMTKRAASR
jgi:hypothetical protein